MTSMLRTVALVVLVAGVAFVYGLIHYFPVVPRSITGWVALLFIGVPFLLLLEAAAQWFHQRQFYRRWPSGLRILFGVIAFLSFLAVIYWPFTFVVGLISS